VTQEVPMKVLVALGLCLALAACGNGIPLIPFI
jgi:predicted small lipoprotein YifL